MSGPQDMQGIAKMFGMPGGPAGPRPPMPLGQSTKRLGDSRVPMSPQIPQRNPGQIQDQAARKLGVPREQVQPTQRPPQAPPQPQIQAPPPPSLPTPMPMPRPQGAPLPPEMNPHPMAEGRTPMPMGRPEGAGPRPPVYGDPGQLNKMISSVLGAIVGGGGGSTRLGRGNEPPSTFPYLSGSNSSAMAKPTPEALPPKPTGDPFSGGASPIQAGPEQLAQIMAGAQRAKAEQEKPPVQAPEATRPSPNVTPPVPPGVPIPPPPSAQQYIPSQPTFKGYEVRPREPKKGEEKDKTKALKKDNNLYYYSRIGAQQDDNSAVAQIVRKLREKVADPKEAKTITPEEDRILTQYSDFAKRGSNYSPNLASMEPEAVAERMRAYKSGGAAQIPERYSERPPGVEGGGDPAQLKLPPKRKDAAVVKAEDYIDNPPPRNATDPDKKIVVEDD